MASGLGVPTSTFVVSRPGPFIPPTVLTTPSAAAATVSSFDLGEHQKRWVVIGVTLNRLLLPVLRDFTSREISKHYASLKRSSAIDTQVYPTYVKNDGPFNFNYGSINNNWGRFKRKKRLYDYTVNTAEDLGKLYLEPHMAKFTGFDNTCDLSAVLGILGKASVFHAHVQSNAKDVHSKVRNEWGHCNFDHWTALEYMKCFQFMETLVRSLKLPAPDEKKVVDDLHDWETKGLQLCMGCPVDKDLMKLVSDEVTNLEQDVEEMRKSNTEEAKKISNSIETIRYKIDEFNKRIVEVENQIDEDRKKQLKQNQAFSEAIDEISSDLTNIEERQDTNEENLASLEKRQSNLESAVSSLTEEQTTLESKVGAVEVNQNELESRVSALELSVDRQSSTSTNATIFHAPSRNPCFCGRDNELQAITNHLEEMASGCAFSAICGLGGVGKTSVAVEYLWRMRREYPGGVFWTSGENNSLFQISITDMARQIGTFEDEFSCTLSKTLGWLQNQNQLWCLVVDNLDELEMSLDLRKLLMGHWKQAAHGHIIVTTRRETKEVSEDVAIEEQFCIGMNCLTEEDGIQLLRMRTEKVEGEDSEIRELVNELGGLPLALDQAAAYIRCLRCSVKDYVLQYKTQKLHLLQRKKAQSRVENTSPERLAVHTTWLLNFEYISRLSEERELGEAPTLVMEMSAFLGPDDIPIEVINKGAPEVDSTCTVYASDTSLGKDEIISLLTEFSLFQRYGTNSYSVHRLVQEVIRSRMDENRKQFILSCATRFLHHALVSTLSPAEVCERFTKDSVFSIEDPPSLQLWGKLASHATYLQEHLSIFTSTNKSSVQKLLHTEETVRLYNEAAIFFSASQEKIRAQDLQKQKLEILVHLEELTLEENPKLPQYFMDIPLKDRDYKLISHCLRQPLPDKEAFADRDTTQNGSKKKADELREQGNLAVKSEHFEEASDLYTKAIGVSSSDYRLYSNRALCHLKLGQPQKAVEDCEQCISLKPFYSKALHRMAWAIHELVKNGSTHLMGRERATAAMAVHFDADLRRDRKFCKMFPEVHYRVIDNGTQLNQDSLMAQEETFLLREGEYEMPFFLAKTDLQFVGLGSKAVLRCKNVCAVVDARCYFENVVFPKANASLFCQEHGGVIVMNRCEISAGSLSCEDYPDCIGGPGCIAKPTCDRSRKIGNPNLQSGIWGSPGVRIFNGAFGLMENCVIHHCGGGGVEVEGEQSHLVVRKCEVYKNHLFGLAARWGGKLSASENRIFDGSCHGVLIAPEAGESLIENNNIFENGKEGVHVDQSTANQVIICNNEIHHNRSSGVVLLLSQVLIENNKIFENGFWGIVANTRTSAHIKENSIFGNKCGGIFIGINYSGRVHLETNIVRDHSGPWLEYYQQHVDSPNAEPALHSGKAIPGVCYPPGEWKYYSNPPILNGNKDINNEERLFHPGEVVGRPCSGCTYCHRSGDELMRLKKCPNCNIASYCSKKCQRKHWPKHTTLCKALKSRYSVTVQLIKLNTIGKNLLAFRIFGSHLKGTGEGPKPKLNSRQKFIVKIQTEPENCHPLQLMSVYDKSVTVDCDIRSPEVFGIIMECGVLGALNRFTSKKAFFWAMFADNGEKLTIFLDHLAPYQEW
ncbi:uncharacterized protein LOC144629874 [Oculina patagonica]